MVAMRRARFLLVLLFAGTLLLPLWRAQAQQTGAAITSPVPGAALQGTVDITGSTPVEGFQFFEVTFGYANDPTGTWFFLTQSDRPVANGLLAQWDTTRISDGDYRLRLLVTMQDGSQVEAQVTGVRVRNYTPVETATPLPPTATPLPLQVTAPAVAPGASETLAVPTPTPTQAAILAPTTLPPTPLPSNPAQLTTSQIWLSLGQGALVVAGLFLLGLAYAWLRSLGRGRR